MNKEAIEKVDEAICSVAIQVKRNVNDQISDAEMVRALAELLRARATITDELFV